MFYDGSTWQNRWVICQLLSTFYRNAKRFLTTHGSRSNLKSVVGRNPLLRNVVDAFCKTCRTRQDVVFLDKNCLGNLGKYCRFLQKSPRRGVFLHVKGVRICKCIIQYIVVRYNSFDKLFSKNFAFYFRLYPKMQKHATNTWCPRLVTCAELVTHRGLEPLFSPWEGDVLGR